MENNVFDVKYQMADSDEFFVAYIDADTGTVIVRGWTQQPINWLDWAHRIAVEYARFRRRGISPGNAARAAREAVMASGPCTTPFIERMELVKFPQLP